MERTFTILFFEHNSGGEILLHKQFVPDAGFDPLSFKRELEQMVDDSLPDGKVTSSRVVVVTGIDGEVNARYLEDVAAKAPTNGVYAQHVELGQEFPSARAASLHLGLKNNEVALYLNKSKHLPQAERVARLRGVALQYRDDWRASMLGNLRD